jgi:hypothetical protein
MQMTLPIALITMQLIRAQFVIARTITIEEITTAVVAIVIVIAAIRREATVIIQTCYPQRHLRNH